MRHAEPTDEQIVQWSLDNPGIGHIVMLDPCAVDPAESVMTWGTPPADFPTNWDDVFNP